MRLSFVTGNKGKWKIARDIFKLYGLDLDQVSMETPEIQSLDVTEVASYSAKSASAEINSAAIKSDVAYYIPALGGFPGPFIKFINKTLTAEQILDLMQNVEDRTMIIKECLSLSIPNQEPINFISELKTTIAKKPAGEGSAIDKVMILDGFDSPKGLLSEDEVHQFFTKSLTVYHDMAKYIKEHY